VSVPLSGTCASRADENLGSGNGLHSDQVVTF